MQNFYHLDQLIHGYFNQDYDLINDDEDTIEGIIGLFKKTAPGWLLKKLAEEIDTFIGCYGDKLDDEFKSRYGFDFSPELWETTSYDFLMKVRRLALA
ncbi:hypothetical protein DW184_15745 [Enterobacter cloacae]|uniref:contact-dependent growth inhibition system immunity protein n=1 Tax=Enterobacter cloacae TaxID=550 RepID=UPI000E4EFDA6|nr:contact-dependent growth inhibition system immunity protein [Enterobacter cloacae]RHI01091.1 hypothetical protein DW184_15745 [Enterobacter cloacae]